VSTAGGAGRIGGPILAIFIIGYLNYGLGLVNIKANVLLIIIGFAPDPIGTGYSTFVSAGIDARLRPSRE